MAKISLPPGFRFHPTDVELVMYYLKRKAMGRKLRFEAIAEVDIYKYDPWDLPGKSCLRSGDLKWYFFCPREKKYANGARTKRATELGYWKTTGKDKPVEYNNEVVGKRKTLVFHMGKAPRGDRTDWVMHEYRIQENDLAERGIVQDAYVLCSVFQKEGPGPRNGAQYGAPFREEEWDDDDMDTDCMGVVSSALLPPVSNQINTVAAGSHVPESQCIGTSESCLSDTIPSTYKVPPPAPTNNDVPKEFTQTSDGDDIERMLALFTDQNEKPDVYAGNIETSPCLDGIDIYKDLGDLGNLTESSGDGYDFFADGNADYNMNGGSMADNMPFIELCDLDAPLNHSCLDGIDIYKDLGDLGNLTGLSGDGYDFFADDNAGYNVNGGYLADNMPFVELCDLDAPLDRPTGNHESEIIANELDSGQNCYTPEPLSCQVNPCSIHSLPMLPEVPTRFEYQLSASPASHMENNGWGNVKQTLLDHGAAAPFKQLSEGSDNAWEKLHCSRSNYP